VFTLDTVDCSLLLALIIISKQWEGRQIPVRCSYVGDSVDLTVQPVGLPWGIFMRNIITDSDVPMLVVENLSNQTVIIDKNKLIGRGKRPEQIARYMIEGENPCRAPTGRLVTLLYILSLL